MMKAKPYPLPRLDGAAPRAEAASGPSGKPGLIPGGPADVRLAPADVLPQDYSYPPPYARYEVFDSFISYPFGFDTYEFPYRTVGVLFYTQNGQDWRCSAASIGNYAVWTAGHCVSDGAGNWSSNFVFVPAYRDGVPVKDWIVWPGSTAWTFTTWHVGADFARDSGGVVLNTNSRGHKVSVIGWLGFAWNWPRDQHWHQIGYPAENPFNGNRMTVCTSSHATDDTSVTPAALGTGCDMTGGSSGGPWVWHFGPSGSGNYLNGNVSYGYIGSPEQMFSPYFDDATLGLWENLLSDVP
jgi:V8-like Glu-specific endopeptidase